MLRELKQSKWIRHGEASEEGKAHMVNADLEWGSLKITYSNGNFITADSEISNTWRIESVDFENDTLVRIEWSEVQTARPRGNITWKRAAPLPAQFRLFEDDIDELASLTIPICPSRHVCGVGCYSRFRSRLDKGQRSLLCLAAQLSDMRETFDNHEIYRTCAELGIPLDEFKHMAENFTLADDMQTDLNVVEFTRQGHPPLRAHASVIARLGGVLAHHLRADAGFASLAPLQMDGAPWAACQLLTVRVLIGFAYLGLDTTVTDAIAALHPNQHWALRELCQFLGSSADAEGASSTLRKLRKAVDKEIRRRASELSDGDD